MSMLRNFSTPIQTCWEEGKVGVTPHRSHTLWGHYVPIIHNKKMLKTTTITSDKITGKHIYEGVTYKIKHDLSDFSSLIVYRQSDNCKLISIGYVNSFLGAGADTETSFKLILDSLFITHGPVGILCTLTSEKDVKQLETLCDLVYCVEVPIGYGNKMQYHCMIRNPERVDYDARLNAVGKLTIGGDVIIKEVEVIKNVIVQEKGITTQQKEKLLGYKTRKWRNRYINSLPIINEE